MRNSKPSSLAAALALSGCLAGASVLPLYSQSGGIAAVTDHHGETVYVNADNSLARAPEVSRYAEARPPQRIESIIQRVSRRHQVDPKLVNAMIRIESDYDSKAVSAKGAMGLMQLIPATAERFGVDDAFDPRQNVEGGVSYLSYLLNRFNGNVPLSLAAYNAGENRVEKAGGIPPIPETRNYVRKITEEYRIEGGSEAAENTAPILEYVDADGVICFSNTD